MIFQLIYTCALDTTFSQADLDEIAKTSRAWSLDKGLTGITLWKDGSVLQVLEGEKETVTAIFEKILEDPRILDPLILIKRTSTRREFPNWSMGYKNAKPNTTAFDLTAHSLSKALPNDVSPEINTIGRTFARVNGLF